MILSPLQKLTNNVGDLGKIIDATALNACPKSKKSPIWSHCSSLTFSVPCCILFRVLMMRTVTITRDKILRTFYPRRLDRVICGISLSATYDGIKCSDWPILSICPPIGK